MATGQIAAGYGNRIAGARQKLGIRQQSAFARLVGVTRQATVSDWETEESEPDLGTLRLIADLFINGDEWFAWLRDGGEMPAVLPKRRYTASGEVIPLTPYVEGPLAGIDLEYGRAMLALSTRATAGLEIPYDLVVQWLSRVHAAAKLEIEAMRRGKARGGES